MLAAVIEQACAAIGASGGGFMRFDAASEELVLQAPAFGVQAEQVVSRYRVRLAEGGNAARVFQSREPTIANDAQHDPRFIQRFVRLFDTHNTITVPLVLNDRTLGIFQPSTNAQAISPLAIAMYWRCWRPCWRAPCTRCCWSHA